MKYITLICFFVLFNSIKPKSIQSNGRIFKTLESYGRSFQIGTLGCEIDGAAVSCSIAKETLKNYNKTINKCNPCWLKEYDYNSQKIKKEGFAVKLGRNALHKVYFGSYTEYNEKGDTLFHKKDSTLNLNIIKQMRPDSIRSYLTNNKKFMKYD